MLAGDFEELFSSSWPVVGVPGFDEAGDFEPLRVSTMGRGI